MSRNILVLIIVRSYLPGAIAQEASPNFISGSILQDSLQIPPKTSQIYLKGLPVRGIQALEINEEGKFERPGFDSVGYQIIVVSTHWDLDLGGRQNSLIRELGFMPSQAHDSTIFIPTEQRIGPEMAHRDIQRGSPKLLFNSGIAGTVHLCHQEDQSDKTIVTYGCDQVYEEKYGVTYVDFGCVPPPIEWINAYNEAVFKHLDELFGPVWREEIVRDKF